MPVTLLSELYVSLKAAINAARFQRIEIEAEELTRITQKAGEWAALPENSITRPPITF